MSDADLTPPVFAACPLGPGDIEAVLRDSSCLPAGVELRGLAPRTFSLLVPGRIAAARVTAAPEVFEEHFESHQMVGHHSPIFRALVELSRCSGAGTAWREMPSLAGLVHVRESGARGPPR